jgi:hypothetical protein
LPYLTDEERNKRYAQEYGVLADGAMKNDEITK